MKLTSFKTFATKATVVNSLQFTHFRTFSPIAFIGSFSADYTTGFMRVKKYYEKIVVHCS